MKYSEENKATEDLAQIAISSTGVMVIDNTDRDRSTDKIMDNIDKDTDVFLTLNKPKLVSKAEYLHHIFDKLEFTREHFFLIFSIFLIRTIEGTEIMCLSLSSSMIEKTFNLPENFSAFINVTILSGNFIGCLISMYFSDKVPRKFLITLGACMILAFGFCSLFTHDIYFFAICRNIVNIGIGLILAGSTALVTESMNTNYRGFVLNLILVGGSLGEVFISICLGWIIDLSNPHDWTKLYLLSMAPVNIIIFN